jgi:putative phosphoribosyl transferase
MKYLEAQIPAGAEKMSGDLIVPDEAKAVVLFVHDSGSSRLSPRNQSVAEIVRAAGMGTLLFNLLTSDEEKRDLTDGLRFDIGFLAERVLAATQWVRDNVPDLSVGYFGASTGAAAALLAAAEAPDIVCAVVSRGGRPDLAGNALPRVRAPTLLFVGELDRTVIEMNQEAYESLACEKQMTIIPGAGHVFDEPGTLDQVARLAADWFERHLRPVTPLLAADASLQPPRPTLTCPLPSQHDLR